MDASATFANIYDNYGSEPDSDGFDRSACTFSSGHRSMCNDAYALFKIGPIR
jgi:hypothetical protein